MSLATGDLKSRKQQKKEAFKRGYAAGVKRKHSDYEIFVRQERERIIKLLETKPAELMCCTCGMDELIALIKEKNK